MQSWRINISPVDLLKGQDPAPQLPDCSDRSLMLQVNQETKVVCVVKEFSPFSQMPSLQRGMLIDTLENSGYAQSRLASHEADLQEREPIVLSHHRNRKAYQQS